MPDITDQISAKYADKVTPEHAAAMQAIVVMHDLLERHRPQMEKLLESKRYMDSVGGLPDPTLYRDMLYSKGFAIQIELVEAALRFLRETDAALAKLTQLNGEKDDAKAKQ